MFFSSIAFAGEKNCSSADHRKAASLDGAADPEKAFEVGKEIQEVFRQQDIYKLYYRFIHFTSTGAPENQEVVEKGLSAVLGKAFLKAVLKAKPSCLPVTANYYALGDIIVYQVNDSGDHKIAGFRPRGEKSKCTLEDYIFASRNYGMDPEKAFAMGEEIQEAIRQKDIEKLYSFLAPEPVAIPRKQEVLEKGFSAVFNDAFVEKIIEAKPSCTPARIRPFHRSSYELGGILYRLDGIEIMNIDNEGSNCIQEDYIKALHPAYITAPEEAFEMGIKIQEAFRQKDIEKLYSFIGAQTVGVPSKRKVIEKGFSAAFDAAFIKSVVGAKPPCSHMSPMLGSLDPYYLLGEIVFKARYGKATIVGMRLKGEDAHCSLRAYANLDWQAHNDDPEEALEVGKRIQEAFRQKDIEKLYSFIGSGTSGAPEKQEVIERGFSAFFDDEFVKKIVEATPDCEFSSNYEVSWYNLPGITYRSNGHIGRITLSVPESLPEASESPSFQLEPTPLPVPENLPEAGEWVWRDKVVAPACLLLSQLNRYDGHIKDLSICNNARRGSSSTYYTILKKVSPLLCTSLAIDIVSNCKKSVFAWVIDKDRYFYIYGIFQIDGKDKVVALKSFESQSDGFDFIDKWGVYNN